MRISVLIQADCCLHGMTGHQRITRLRSLTSFLRWMGLFSSMCFLCSLGLGLLSGACSGSNPTEAFCNPGTETACSCGDGALEGTQICNEDGTAWGDCICPEDPCIDMDCPPGRVCQIVNNEAVCVPDPETWEDPLVTTVNPPETDEVFLNPERGFYRYANIVNNNNFSQIRENGSSIVFSYVRLDDYRDRDLDDTILEAMQEGLDGVRNGGLKLILRFAYNFGPYPDSEPDATKTWVLRHIEQVGPILRDNADVITVMQAGFIGAWGEWHSSTNGLLDNYRDKYDILEAILDELPPERMVQLRYPGHKREEYGDSLLPAEAHTQTFAARIGHHNDCFLASDLDMGTYPWGEDPEPWKTYISDDTHYVPMGGETCAVYAPRSDCPTALEEMERLHYSYINNDYHPEVVANWEAQGCRPEMERRLGYRFTITEVTYPPEARPGGSLPLEISLRNDGWAAPYNPRPLYLVLSGPETHLLTVPPNQNGDIRFWLSGGEPDIAIRAKLPGDLTPGTYQLSLSLPDESDNLAEDPRYSIRLANQDTWDADTGLNHLAELEIHSEAPGSADPSFSNFELW